MNGLDATWQDLLPGLHDSELVDEPADVQTMYRQIGAMIQDAGRRLWDGPAIEAWKLRSREALDRHCDALELRTSTRERDFYRGLVDLTSTHEVKPLLGPTLQLVAEVTGAAAAYLELFDDAVPPRSWKSPSVRDEDLVSMRAAIARARAASTPVEGRVTELESVRDLVNRTTLCCPIGSNPAIGMICLHGTVRSEPFDTSDRKHVALLASRLAALAEYWVPPRDTSDHTVAIRERLACPELVGRSPAVAHMLSLAANICKLDASVLITGPSGSGRSLLARVIHNNSSRRDRPFIEVNCATIPEQLMESELFGTEPWSRWTATPRIQGRIAASESGTLFLAEISELSLGAQAKLVRLLETGVYFPAGSDDPVHLDVRILASTSVDLQRCIAAGQFRKDLFGRMHFYPLEVPALETRREDIPELVERFVVDACCRHQLSPLPVSWGALIGCQQAAWPGHVRQLGTAIEVAVIRARGEGAPSLRERHVFPKTGPDVDMTFVEASHRFQHRILLEALERNDWKVAETARDLGLSRAHVRQLIAKFRLTR
jgi:Nif-specific regulatory protein